MGNITEKNNSKETMINHIYDTRKSIFISLFFPTLLFGMNVTSNEIATERVSDETTSPAESAATHSSVYTEIGDFTLMNPEGDKTMSLLDYIRYNKEKFLLNTVDSSKKGIVYCIKLYGPPLAFYAADTALTGGIVTQTIATKIIYLQGAHQAALLAGLVGLAATESLCTNEHDTGATEPERDYTVVLYDVDSDPVRSVNMLQNGGR